MGTARWILWVSMTMRILSLKQRTGFERIEAKAREEYWQKVYSFLETGYLQSLCFRTVSAVNAQTCLNGYYRVQ